MDCFVASLLAMTLLQLPTRPRDLAARCARVLLKNPALFMQRAQGMPGARRARSLACRKNTRVSHHGHAGNTRHSPRNGFNGYFALSPVTGLFCHRRPQIESANLTPASGRQDHTTSPSARRTLVRCAAHVHRIPCPTSVTIAKRPSVWDGMARDMQVICVRREWKYF
jgi:hypothetical protein